jgi:hypothetical protein
MNMMVHPSKKEQHRLSLRKHNHKSIMLNLNKNYLNSLSRMASTGKSHYYNIYGEDKQILHMGDISKFFG